MTAMSHNEDKIIIKGAREHNLKNIDVEIPKNKLVVFTGLSGSGKSSLAFDTIYAEGQRRYVESLSSYARQFLGIMDKPDLDYIGGLSPAIAIDQKTTSHNPRSTVGTITEIYDYLRLLFARTGHPHCANCGREITHLTMDQIIDQFKRHVAESSSFSNDKKKIMILAPLVRERKGEYSKLLDGILEKGFSRVRVDGKVYELDHDLVLIKTNKHTIEAIVDRLVIDKKNLESQLGRIRESVESALKLSGGEVILTFVLDSSLEFPENPEKMQDHLFSERFACPECGISINEPEPNMFSFNSPEGACPSCTGLGYLLKIDPELLINPDLSISEGGILPLGNEVEHDTWFIRTIRAVSDKYGFSIQVPIKKLSAEHLKIVLYGSGDEEIYVKGNNREGKMTGFYEKFEGVITRLERLYRETESDWRRTDIQKYMRNEVCPKCLGERLKPEALSVTVNSKNIMQVAKSSIEETLNFVEEISKQFEKDSRESLIATPIIKELRARLGFLVDVGLTYLTLARSANTLAGGETQRIRLASQIGSGLSGVLYVLDEPSIGLHQKDNSRLIETLKNLRELGNTIIVVEHDREMMEESDLILDFGPGAGEHGGQIIASGTPEQIKANPKSLTGQYLCGKKEVEWAPSKNLMLAIPNEWGDKKLILIGAKEHNLKNLTVEFPLGKFICITGVSGSGKSTLIHDILYQSLASKLYPGHKEKPGQFDEIVGDEYLDKVVIVDQSPIGRTPRSNPATYTGMFTPIREVFASTKEAKVRGFKPDRFSFNVKGGRCEACEGEGQLKIEMNFLPDVYVTCEVCQGKRYNAQALEVLYKDKSIAGVLEMTVEEASTFFNNHPAIIKKLTTLLDVGLGYIKLGQSAPTLSGGEAQRVKLATELSKKATGRTVYILDEPTTGLHFADLEKLLYVLKTLVHYGNTVIVIEHNLDLIKNADHIIDLGPGGGDSGGEIIATGTPSEVAKNEKSWTGKYLKKFL